MASLRERPFVSKPSDALKARMEQARQGGFFVVQTPGPTSFVLKSDQESKKLKVNIGSVHSCSCGAREQPCVHVAFVLLRVFRLEPTDQRCWQASLTDSELEALVDSRARAAAMRRLEARQWAAAPPQSDNDCEECDPLDVPRRPIDDTADPDPCPICYEDIGPEDDEAGELDWCRRSCGKSLHRRCFARWAEHQTAIGQKLSCPHCRGEWASGPAEAMRPRPTAETMRAGARGGLRAAGGASAPGRRPPSHRGARCRSCRATPIVGARYRCLVCPTVPWPTELCADCYASCMHPEHPFGVKERPGGTWAAATCRRDVYGVETGAPDEDTPSGTGGGVSSSVSSSGGSSGIGSGGGGGGGSRGGGGGTEAAMAGHSLHEAVASLQHREITPEDYDLLLALSNPHSGLALSNPHSGLGGRASVAYDVPSAATRSAHGSASSGVASRRDERRVDVSLAARVVVYDAAQIAPLLAELNEIEAEAQRDRAAVGAAKRPGAANGTVAVTSGTLLPTPPPLMDIAGQGISIGRAAGGETPASLRAIGRSPSGGGGGGGGSAAFSSGVGRPWQQSRAPASVAAERIAADRMAACAGIGFEDINLIGNSLGMARSGPLARTEAVLPRAEAVPMGLPNLGLPAEPSSSSSLPSLAREPLTTQPPPMRARGGSGGIARGPTPAAAAAAASATALRRESVALQIAAQAAMTGGLARVASREMPNLGGLGREMPNLGCLGGAEAGGGTTQIRQAGSSGRAGSSGAAGSSRTGGEGGSGPTVAAARLPNLGCASTGSDPTVAGPTAVAAIGGDRAASRRPTGTGTGTGHLVRGGAVAGRRAPANPGASLVPPPPDPNTPLGFMDGLVGRAFSGAAAR